MRPNIAQPLREEAVVQARQTIERRVNELGVTEPSIAQQGADQILVQLPGVTDVDRAKEIIGSPGMLELKLVEQGPAASREDRPARHRRRRAAGHGSADGVGRCADRRRPAFLSRAPRGGGDRPGSAQRARAARREQHARGRLHAEPSGRGGVRARHGREHRALPRDRARQDGAVGAAHRRAHCRRRADRRQVHAGGSAEPRADPALGRAAGDADVSAGADDRPDARRRLDSLGRARVGRRAAARSACSC